MINVNELRIGNLVLFNDEICKVSGYSHSFIHLNDGKKGCIAEKINPIKLTDEIFKKFNFKEDEFCLNKYFYKQIEIGVQIRSHVDNIYLDICDQEYEVAYEINKYVHQLQNLFFALTNEELTFIE